MKDKPSCVLPMVNKCVLKMGEEGLRYLQKRTKKEPFFAFATGALHGGPITYDAQQKYVEKISGLDTIKMEDEEYNKKLIKGAQFWPTRARSLAFCAKCYNKHCGKDGKKCLTNVGRETAMKCLDSHQSQIGRKTKDLMREYLGDNNAVAVDRHVMDWVCNTANICFTGKVKGKPISPKEYERIKLEVRKLARKHHVDPAVLQVTLWLKGVCKSKTERRTGDNIYLGEGKSVKCCGELSCER
jgi:endonuclease III